MEDKEGIIALMTSSESEDDEPQLENLSTDLDLGKSESSRGTKQSHSSREQIEN